ncbi:hypothetical protein [Burkholderia cepacia]|uniref:hypothetical protein n=1 Tax=Burkholderia cepacia TaxID=292 RepID=UPI00158B871D|nr:hypothetical protein [Burkholderia cepacia]
MDPPLPLTISAIELQGQVDEIGRVDVEGMFICGVDLARRAKLHRARHKGCAQALPLGGMKIVFVAGICCTFDCSLSALEVQRDIPNLGT